MKVKLSNLHRCRAGTSPMSTLACGKVHKMENTTGKRISIGTLALPRISFIGMLTILMMVRMVCYIFIR